MKVIHRNNFSQLYNQANQEPLDSRIVLIDDPRWDSCLEDFERASVIGYDIETFGIESWHPLWFRTGCIRLVQVSLSEDCVLIANLGGWEDDRELEKSKYAEFLRILGLKLPDPEVAVIGVNLKFDGVFTLAHLGIKLRGARDLMLMSQVLHGGVAVLPSGASVRQLLGHGLGKIAERAGMPMDKEEQLSNWGWGLTNAQINYAGRDGLNLHPLCQHLGKQIVADGLTYSAKAECAALAAFIDMEFYGMPVDTDLLNDYIKQHEDRLEVVIQPFLDKYPGINWNSGDQIIEAVNEKHPELKLTSTSSEVLAPLGISEFDALLKARTIQTTKNYLQNLRDVAFQWRGQELMSVRGFYQQIAPEATGRSSCRSSLGRRSGNIGAQLQNPKSSSADPGFLPHPRNIFRVPDTHRLIILDAAGAHARISTSMAKAKVLIEAYNNGLDNHSLLAVEVAKIARDYYLQLKREKKRILPALQSLFDAMPEGRSWTFDEFLAGKKKVRVMKDLRDISKVILYGSLNGGGVKRLTNQMLGSGFEWVNPEVVAPARQSFYDLYPEIPKLIKDNFRQANQKNVDFNNFTDTNGYPIRDTYGYYGYVTTMTGRRKYLAKEEKEAWGKIVHQVDYGKATAALWLMAEGDMMKNWLGECILEFDKNPHWGAYIANMAHDEVNAVAYTEYALDVATFMYQSMKRIFEGWFKIIPFDENLTEPDYTQFIGSDWAELH